MSYVPPTTWEEVPGAVRAALLDPFEKRAEEGMWGLRHLADVMGWRAGSANAFWGGPRPVSNLLIGAGLGGLGGYGLGRLGEAVLPTEYFKDKAVRRRAAILGAALGAAPAAWQVVDNARNTGDFPSSAFSRWPQETKEAADQAMKEAAGELFEPVINRMMFNQAIFADPNTPLPLRALTSGLVEAASATSGGVDWVSPWSVAKVVAGTGSGLVSGIIAGKALGFLAGLNDKGQEAVQRLGLWSGLLRNTIPQAFGLR